MAAAEALVSLDDLLTSLDREGRGFELLCRWFLENDPEFAAEYRKVWLWRDWPGRWGPDRGIDLVAETFTGRNDAVQAKNYGAAHTVTKRDLDTFLSESNRAEIGARLLMASTDHLAASARGVMDAQEKPVSTCLLSRLRESAVRWPASLAELTPAAPAAAEPREHQVAALAAIERWAAGGGKRGQVIMPCGTGKTLIEIWAAERLGARHVLVLVPTIPLLGQFAREWPQHAALSRRTLRICGDRELAEAEDFARGDELSVARTTDPAEIAAALRGEGPLLVLCTYASSPTLAEAMASVPGFSFDLAIADEAHRCAGLESSKHKTILDAEAIRAARRLFFTATPTVYGTRDKTRAATRNVRLASMDDRQLFGHVVHHLTFAQAIELGLLCPYQVAVIPVDDEEVHEMIQRRQLVTADGDHALEAASLATQIACARAMRTFGCRRIVAFHRSIPASKRFSEHFPVAAGMLAADEQPPGSIWSEHIDGAGMPHARRRQLLTHFEREDEGEHRLLSNVKLLTEGVNVPGIDAIAFIDTHRGQQAIIQGVGRAVRPAEGKTVGTIVLPIVLRKGESVDAALARSEHRPIIDILGALRSHDQDIIKSLDDLRFYAGPGEAPPTAHGRFVIDAPREVGQKFADAVDLALTEALGVATERRARSPRAQIQIVAERTPPSEEELIAIGLARIETLGRWELLAAVPAATGDGFPIGGWWTEVKQRWADGRLEEGDRVAIAQCVSWLTPDLESCPRQRREMARLTYADVPEQIAAQCRPGGRYEERFAALTGWQDAEALVEPLTEIQLMITHAAMLPGLRLRYMLCATRRLALTVDEAARAECAPEWWEARSYSQAVIDAFVYRLRVAHLCRDGDDPPEVPWSIRQWPTAHLIGYRGAEPLALLAERMRIYRSHADHELVEERLALEDELPPDQCLDALGWEILLLERFRGSVRLDALGLESEPLHTDTLRRREKLRDDLRDRSLRELQRAADDAERPAR